MSRPKPRHTTSTRNRIHSSSLHPATSRFSMDWIGRHLGGAERRRVTILAVAPVARLGWLDPEEMAPAVDRYRREALRAIMELGGQIIGQSGISVLACWGFPSSGEDHLRLALRAGLRIAALTSPDLQLGCGVETGLVVAGPPIAGEAQTINLVGPVLRKAELLQASARPGWVVVSDAVRPLVDRTFELECLAPLGMTSVC